MTARSPAERQASAVIAHRWSRRTVAVIGCVWLGGVVAAGGVLLHQHVTGRLGTAGLLAVAVLTLGTSFAAAWCGGALLERYWPTPTPPDPDR